MDSGVAAIIVSLIALAGTIYSANAGNKKIENQLNINQAVMDTKLDALTEEVKRHNNFAARMPVVEEQIKVINHRLEDLEQAKG